MLESSEDLFSSSGGQARAFSASGEPATTSSTLRTRSVRSSNLRSGGGDGGVTSDSPRTAAARTMQLNQSASLDDAFAPPDMAGSNTQRLSRHQSHDSTTTTATSSSSSRPPPVYASVARPSNGREAASSGSSARHGQNVQRSTSGGTSSSSSSSQRQQRQPAPMLDFSRAMGDFSEMFPDMDTEIIEAVLRANEGAVEPTIDQLVSMSCDSSNDVIDGDTPPPPLPPRVLQPSSPSSPGDEASRQTLDAARRARQELERMLAEARDVERAAMTGSSGQNSMDSPPPPLPPKERRAVHSAVPTHSHHHRATSRPSVARSRSSTSGLVAPLVGPLPADFLRLTGSSPPATGATSSLTLREPHRQVFPPTTTSSTSSRRHSHSHQQHHSSAAASSAASASTKHQHVAGEKRGRYVARSSSSRETDNQVRHKKHHYNIAELNLGGGAGAGAGGGSGRPAQPPRPRTSTMPASTRNASNQAQMRSRSDSVRRGLLPAGTSPITQAGQAMTEDGVLLSLVTSTSAEQMREDERCAMMLQNAEFMAELGRNRDFINALQDDNSEEEEEMHAPLAPVNTVSPHHSDARRQPPVMIRNDTSPEPRDSPPPQSSGTPVGTRSGSDSPTVVTPTSGFRERRASRASQIQRQASVSAEKMRNALLSGKMKESTRQLFHQLYRKFQRRQKRQINLDEAVAGSNVALLDEDSDDEVNTADDGDYSRLAFLNDGDFGGMPHGGGGGEGYAPGYAQIGGRSISHGDSDGDDALLTDLHETTSPRALSPDSLFPQQQGAVRHGNQRVSPFQAHGDTEPITFYAEEEDDDLQIGFPPVHLTAFGRRASGESDA